MSMRSHRLNLTWEREAIWDMSRTSRRDTTNTLPTHLCLQRWLLYPFTPALRSNAFLALLTQNIQRPSWQVSRQGSGRGFQGDLVLPAQPPHPCRAASPCPSCRAATPCESPDSRWPPRAAPNVRPKFSFRWTAKSLRAQVLT